MALSAPDAIQAKTGSATAASIDVVLDAGTQQDSTVIIELNCSGTPLLQLGMTNTVPDAFQMDAVLPVAGVPYFYVFRKPFVPAGDGVAGLTPWSFTPGIGSVIWTWRVTEWSSNMEPYFPLDAAAGTNFLTLGSSPSTLSTGTTSTTNHAEVVALGWHHWHRSTAGTPTMSFSNLTNGFDQRDQQAYTSGNLSMVDCWSWAFGAGTAQAWECTADVAISAHDVTDNYFGLMMAYATTASP